MDILLLIPLIFFVIFAVINCAIRGRKRSLVRIALILLSCALAIFLTPVISEKYVESDPLWQLQEGSVLWELTEASPSLGAVIDGAQVSIWSMVFYPAVFLALCVVMVIPGAIINRKTERTHNGSGALIGIAAGLLVFTLTFAPICAAGTIAGDAMKETLREEWDLDEFNEHFGLNLDMDKIMNSDTILHAEAVPGRPLLNLLTSVQADGKRVSLAKELKNLTSLEPLYRQYVTGDADAAGMSALLTGFADCVESSDFLTGAFDELQTAAREKWSNKEEFLGYNPKKPDGSLGEYLADVVCSSETNLSARELADKILAIISPEGN